MISYPIAAAEVSELIKVIKRNKQAKATAPKKFTSFKQKKNQRMQNPQKSHIVPAQDDPTAVKKITSKWLST